MICMASALLVGACKPSEKNYRAAYDAARSKNERQMENLGTNEHSFESIDGIRKIVINNQTIYKDTETLASIVESGRQPEAGTGSLGVAVGCYTMPTNARSQIEDLRKSLPGVSLAKTGAGKWYVIIKLCQTEEEAAEAISTFLARHKDVVCPGLPTRTPLIIEVRGHSK